jgi:hypothetical protein
MPRTLAAPSAPARQLFQVLADVNLHFDQIREQVTRLKKLAVLRGRSGRAFFPAFEAAVSEAQAWFNTEFLEAQGEVESREWARLDLLRLRREKPFREIEAAKRRRPEAARGSKRK